MPEKIFRFTLKVKTQRCFFNAPQRSFTRSVNRPSKCFSIFPSNFYIYFFVLNYSISKQEFHRHVLKQLEFYIQDGHSVGKFLLRNFVDSFFFMVYYSQILNLGLIQNKLEKMQLLRSCSVILACRYFFKTKVL